jgi:hypothetical protein
MSGGLRGRLLVVCGVAAVGLGVVAAAVPGAAGLLGGSDSVVLLVGLAALAGTARAASDFWSLPRRRTELPDAHRLDAVTVAGEPFDRALDRSGRRGQTGRRSRDRIVRHLRSVAVDVLTAATGDAAAIVERRLDDGNWTDDPVAAALFTEEYEPTLGNRLRNLLGRPTTFQRRVDHAVAALEDRAEER